MAEGCREGSGEWSGKRDCCCLWWQAALCQNAELRLCIQNGNGNVQSFVHKMSVAKRGEVDTHTHRHTDTYVLPANGCLTRRRRERGARVGEAGLVA